MSGPAKSDFVLDETANPAPRADSLDPAFFGQTPSQTVGPYFHYGLPWKGGADLVGQSDLGARPDLFPEENWVLNLQGPRGPVQGEKIALVGKVIDGDGKIVTDAMVEIWQANAAGRYASLADTRAEVPLDDNFIGFGRSATTVDGEYHFRTIRPGRVPGPGNSLQAPHIAISVFARGMLKRATTRLYFDDVAENGECPILALVPEDRRHTLIAKREGEGLYRLDIVLQGDGETVFFDV
jgi:protocatechuate 3,4-dioxygenase alpha subunit